MEIKYGKRDFITCLCFLVGINLFLIVMFIIDGGDFRDLDAEEIREGILLLAMMTFVTARMCICEGRTLVMDEEGCTVRFLCFKKKYFWKDMKVKRIEHYYNLPRSNNAYYTDGAVFSVHSIHKPLGMHPYIYGDLIHPFSFFYVYFTLKDDKEKGIKSPMNYEVDEDEFCDMLESWNVGLVETRGAWYRRKK